MNENDKILITAYLDGETSNDETIYIESLLESNKEAHEYANNIKRANAEINSYFNSSEFNDLKKNVDTFIEQQVLKSKKNKLSFGNFFSNPKYYGFAASVFFLAIILVPTFNQNKFEDLPLYPIPLERDSATIINFQKILEDAVLEYGDKSIWAFKIQSDESTLIIQIDDFKNNCYSGTVTRTETSDIKEFQVCKE